MITTLFMFRKLPFQFGNMFRPDQFSSNAIIFDESYLTVTLQVILLRWETSLKDIAVVVLDVLIQVLTFKQCRMDTFAEMQ